MRVESVVLAAGQGVRMKSALPKVLHAIAGRPMILYALDAAAAVTASPPVVVVGHGSDQIRAVVGERARYAEQTEQLGTGHAVMQARPALGDETDVVLVTYGDMPLLAPETLRALVSRHIEREATITMLTVVLPDPHGFGRVRRDGTGRVLAIVEEAQCTREQLAIRELNAGVYCFAAGWLWDNLPQLPLSPKGEYYLTDLVARAVDQGRALEAVTTEDASEVLGINTRVHLAEAEQIMRQRINRQWMESGVTLVDPATTYIDATARIGQDTIILPNTHLLGRTSIGSQCRIGPGSWLHDTEVADACQVFMSVLEEAVMEEGSNIGPFSHLRKGAHLCRDAHMGNFAEMKNSTLGPGAKMGHFSYLGDATVGANVNIGCGTITCNFDGQRKHPTVLEDDVFIGSDTMLVAPLHVGKGAKTGAGAVVTHDVPPGALAFGVPARVRRMLDATTEEHAEE